MLTSLLVLIVTFVFSTCNRQILTFVVSFPYLQKAITPALRSCNTGAVAAYNIYFYGRSALSDYLP